MFSEEQLSPASDPSAQIVDAKGSFLVQIYFLTVEANTGVGGGGGGLVGGENVGGFEGEFVGGLVRTGVGLGEGGVVGLGVLGVQRPPYSIRTLAVVPVDSTVITKFLPALR